MAYQRTKTDSKTDRAAIALNFISKNPGFSAAFTGLLLAGIMGVFGPSQEIRSLSQRTGFMAGGAFIAYGACDRKLGALQADVKRYADSAATVASKASQLELKAQQLSAVEATMRARVETELKSASVRELEKSKAALSRETDRVRSVISREKVALERKIATADRNLETVKANLAKAVLDLNELKLTHSNQIAAINIDAQQAQRVAVDAALLDKQVALDAAIAKADAATVEAKEARQALDRANRTLEAYQSQLGEANDKFNQKLAQTAQQLHAVATAPYEEAELEAKASIERTALELRWEKQERLKTAHENAMLKGPKFTTEDSDMGRRNRKLHAAIHALSNRFTDEKGQIKEINHGFLMHESGMRRDGPNDVFSYRPCSSTTGNASELAKHAEALGWAIEINQPVKVTHNAEKGCIDITVPQGRRVPVATKDMSRILKSAETFTRNSAAWHRSRITGGSESGKSPTSELIAYSAAAQLDADLHFHNPVANSLKAHMTLPQVSSGDDECLAALIQLGADLEAMSNGTKTRPAKFQYHVFDEVDTLITGNQEAIKAIELIIKRGSHYGIGIALLGQSDAVTVFSGMTHSDMNNLTQIAICKMTFTSAPE